MTVIPALVIPPVAVACKVDAYKPMLAAMALVQTGPTGSQGPAGAGLIAGLSSDGASGIAVTGAVKAKNLVLNPKQFGALCNGSDDSAAVQAMFNAATPGSTIEFTCMASVGHSGWSGLTVPVSNVKIRATHGAGLTILFVPSQRILGNTAPNITLFVSGRSHVDIDGLEINGNGINTGLIGLQTCTYCAVENSYLHNSAGSGASSANAISAINGSYNSFINNRVIGTGHGLYIGNAVSGQQEDHDLITQNDITNCNASGIAYNGSHGRIASNVSSHNAGSGIAVSSGTGAIQVETQVLNNILRYNLFHGVQSDTTGGASNSPRNISIVGNDVAYNTGAGVYAPNAVNWTIANNKALDNGQGGSTVQAFVIGPNAQNIVASGNTCADDQGKHTQTACFQANAQNVAGSLSNITIAHNVSSFGAGVQVFQGGASGTGSGISIIGNTITGAAGGYGIQIDPPFTSVVIASNNVSGSGNADIRNDVASSATFGAGNAFSTSSGHIPVGPVNITGTSSLRASATTHAVSGGGVACHVEYSIVNSWPGGFQAAIIIQNTGSTAWSSWDLTWTFANRQTINGLWNGAASQNGGNVTVQNYSYNGTIPAGGSYNRVGLTGTWKTPPTRCPRRLRSTGRFATSGDVDAKGNCGGAEVELLRHYINSCRASGLVGTVLGTMQIGRFQERL